MAGSARRPLVFSTIQKRWLRPAVVAGVAGPLIGCGSGLPLLHPAHPLSEGEVSGALGLTTSFGTARAHQDLRADRSIGGSGTREERRNLALSVLTEALVGPGSSPWLGARVGLANSSEAGLTITGRTLRLDGRKVFELDEWAVSAGLGAGVLSLRNNLQTEREEDGSLQARGWAVDAPFFVGRNFAGGFVQTWLGAQIGYERLSGEFSSSGLGPGTQWSAEGRRWWLGSSFGFSVGVPPVSLQAGVSARNHWMSGQLSEIGDDSTAAPEDSEPIDVSRWTFEPSIGLAGHF